MGVEIIEFWKKMNNEGRKILLNCAKDIMGHKEYVQSNIIDIGSQFNKALELGNSGHEIRTNNFF